MSTDGTARRGQHEKRQHEKRQHEKRQRERMLRKRERSNGKKVGGGAAAQPDADGGTACLACIARTGAPRGAAPPHSVTIQALPIQVQVVTSKTQRLFLPNMTPNTVGSSRVYGRDLRNQLLPGFAAARVRCDP